MNIDVKTNADRVAKVLGRIPSAVEKHLAAAQVRMAEDQIETMKLRMRRGDVGEGLVRTRSGLLSRSFTKEQRRSGGVGGLRTRVFSAGIKYAEIQERGGVVRPTKSKFLTIPMPSILNASGIVKGQYSGGARAYGNSGAFTFLYRSKDGKGLYVAEVQAKGSGRNRKGVLTLLWKLVRSVTLKGNLGWYATWKRAEPERRRIIDRVASDVLKEAQAGP